MELNIDEYGLIKFSSKNVVGTVKVEMSLKEKDIDDIMVTAIEGGINYWGYLLKRGEDWEFKPRNVPSSQWATKLLLEGKNVIIKDREEDDEYELTLEKLIKGFEQNYKERPWDNDLENGDATTCDCIVQYALFNEVVFG